MSKAQSKLQVDDLLVTAERYSARENRINLAIIGDGYQVEELESLYQATVRDTLDYFFTHPKSAPYPRYQAFFNVFRIDIASNDSGVDDLEREIYRDTALGGENACTDYTIGICGADWSLVHEAFDLAEISAGFVADWRLVLLNDDSYNAAAHYAADGTLPIYSANYQGVWDMRDIALHEGAHAWHYLADEYGGDPGIYPYAEPSEVNVTKDSSGAKWSEWLDYVMPDGMVVGAYEGGRYYDRGIFRPTISSKMNGGPADCHNIDNDCGHNAVSIQKIILDIYRLVRPLDGHTPAETVLTDPESLSVMVIDPEVVKVNWSIDGQRILEAGPETLVLDELLKVPGAYQVTAHAYDEVVVHAFSDNARPHSLDLVRRDFELLQQTVTWQVEIGDNDADGTGNNADTDDDNDGVSDSADAFPLDADESVDTDGDGIGNNADLDDDNDGFTDEQERADGTEPLSRFSCRTGCFSFDVDENLEAQPLTDGLLVIRHLFGFSGDSLTSSAVSIGASRNASDAIASYLTDADSQLDIDGDGESKPLTDGLLLIRYLFGFSGDSLISGAIGDGAERDTAEEVEAYILERIPVQ
ncbi:M64 family metallopeptidase [Pseudomonadales bacterium]|nr:M64 family metallopeptidase [Pseudomonadales bacterium]